MNVIEPPIKLVATEYQSRMPGGMSKPCLVLAQDDEGNQHKIVLKFRKPGGRIGVDDAMAGGHYEGTSLACELICAVVARMLNLSVPNYAIVNITDEFSQTIPNNIVKKLATANKGENFGTIYYPNSPMYIPDARKRSDATMDQLENVLKFDSLIHNGDRGARKPNLLEFGGNLIMIDHSLALMVNNLSKDAIMKSPLLPEKSVRDHCSYNVLSQKSRTFDCLKDEWVLCVSDDQLKQIRGMIPASWERKAGDLDMLFNLLSKRHLRLDAIAKDLRRIMQ